MDKRAGMTSLSSKLLCVSPGFNREIRLCLTATAIYPGIQMVLAVTISMVPVNCSGSRHFV